MCKKYKHINVEERIRLYKLLSSGNSIQKIANQLQFHKSTIYRELARNSSIYGYRPDTASQKYYYRRKTSKRTKLDKNPILKIYVIEKLKAGHSPEQISGRLKLLHGKCIVSHETIYKYMYSEYGIKLKLYKCLRKQRRYRFPRVKRRRYRRSKPKNKESIHDRPDSINDRSKLGHWEGDLIVFKKQKTNLFTLRERKSRFIIAIKNRNRKAKNTANTLIKYMKQKSQLVKKCNSITLDNGVEFYEHQLLTHELGADVYFCDPYKSYQKGAIENANRDLRRYYPRKTKMAHITQNNIDLTTNELNNLPMKCLGFRTPHEVFWDVNPKNLVAPLV